MAKRPSETAEGAAAVTAKAWQGDWRARLDARVAEHGFADVTAFAASHPAEHPLGLAARLGDDIAAIQIVKALIDEAEARGEMAVLARDLLARTLSHHLPNGWRAECTPDEAFERADAQGEWSSWLLDVPKDTKRRILEALRSPGAVPDGWRPAGADDPVLVALFSEHWP